MMQLPLAIFRDPADHQRSILLICATGWLAAAASVARPNVSWTEFCLIVEAVLASMLALFLTIRALRADYRSKAEEKVSSAERGLHGSEQNLRNMLNRIPAFVHTLTPDGQLEFVNQTMLEFFGKSIDELKEWTGVVHPDDIATVTNRLRTAFETGQPFEVEARCLRFDGVYRWFLERGLPMRDPNGHIVRWCHHLTDIDDKKRAEEALRTSERSLRLIVDSIPGAVIVQSPSGSIEFINQQAIQYFGLAIEEFRSHLRSGLVYEDDLAQFTSSQEGAFSSGNPFECDFRGRRADGGYRWIHQRAHPLKDAEDHVICWYTLLIDVHEQRMALEELRRAQTRLSRAAQIATIAELSASIAHEITQPLGAIVANGQACLNWLTAGEPNIERAVLSAEKVIRNGNNAAHVIQRMRALFRKAPPSKDRVNINEIVQEVCGIIRDELQNKDVILTTKLRPNLPHVIADSVQLQQLLANLTRNAIEAMESTLSRRKEVLISSMSDTDTIVVHVADMGVGIGDNELLFEPFFTTKTKGLGMGLSICKSIVEAHDGRIWAVSNEGAGSTFGFSLPI
jgi:PAS domain S-box-containing protein